METFFSASAAILFSLSILGFMIFGFPALSWRSALIGFIICATMFSLALVCVVIVCFLEGASLFWPIFYGVMAFICILFDAGLVVGLVEEVKLKNKE